VRDSCGEHEQRIVGDRVNDPVTSDANAVMLVLPGKLLAPDRPWLNGQRETDWRLST
jgi:hypothetical protein